MAAALFVLSTLGLAACSGAATPSVGPSEGAGASARAPDGGGAAGGIERHGGGGRINRRVRHRQPGQLRALRRDLGVGARLGRRHRHRRHHHEVGQGNVREHLGSPDGSITFTSGAPELKSGSYKGTGAQVHMKDAGGTQLPCGWTLDNDLTGTDGVIHLKGTMDVIGTVWGCPG